MYIFKIINKKLITYLMIGVFFALLLQFNSEEGFLQNADASSPISIYSDTYSPGSIIHILIHAPDFNSNPYTIDTIGDDSNGIVTISTREASIPYMLEETGPDTGIFSGEVILSSTTSVCSPVCGPTDGYIAAGGDDGITVSFTYSIGRSITSTWYPHPDHQTVPEFGMLSGLTITLSIISVIIISRKFTKN
ncbi:MAG: hypothetical protein ABI340_10040 [Nitrososphaera sp.]|jgi:hypothetical protein